MAPALPPGHPGDLMWRLPLTRTLSSMHAVTTEQVQAATSAAGQGGLFVTHLVEAGASPDKVLTAWALATGLPSAPRYETRNPPLALAARGDEALWRSLLCVPFATEHEQLCVACAVPLPADKAALLPPHKAFVALEGEVLHGLDHLYAPYHRKHPGPSAPTPGLVAAPASVAPPPPAVAVEPPPRAPPPPGLEPAGAPPMPSLEAPADALALPALELASGGAPLQGAGGPPALPPTALSPAPHSEVAAPATPQPGSPSGPQAGVPAAAPVQPLKVHVDAAVPYQEDRFAELKGQLRVLRLPFAAVVGLVVLVKVGSCVIDRSRAEVDQKSDRLGDGIQAANEEAQRNRAAELRSGAPAPELRPEPAPAPAPVPVKLAGGTFDSVLTALAEADLAARTAPAAFPSKCRALATELMAYRVKTPLPVKEQAALQGLHDEVSARCEQESGGTDFGPLRDKVSRALRGE